MENTQVVKISSNGNISHVNVDMSKDESYDNHLGDEVDFIALERDLDLWYCLDSSNAINNTAIKIVKNLSENKKGLDIKIHGDVLITKVDNTTGEYIPLTPEDIANIDLA